MEIKTMQNFFLKLFEGMDESPIVLKIEIIETSKHDTATTVLFKDWGISIPELPEFISIANVFAYTDSIRITFWINLDKLTEYLKKEGL